MTDKLEEIRARWSSDDPQKLYISHEEAIYLLRIAEAAKEARCPNCGVWSREAQPLRDTLDALKAGEGTG